MKEGLAGSRRRQILQTLNENGPLSVRVLEQVMRPRTSMRNIQKVVRRLRSQGLLTVHFESVHYAGNNFYRMSHDLEARAKIGRWLGVHPEELRQPKFFSKELLHTTKCALWVAYLKDLFPEATVQRDIQLIKQRTYGDAERAEEADRDHFPDIILSFPGATESDEVSIAFEIERTRKSNRKLTTKIRKLIECSVLDGVIYVCESGGVKDAISALLVKRKLLSSPRIRHYGSAFILFTDNSNVSTARPPRLVNVEGKSIPLTAWITAMKDVSADYRRNSHFLEP